MQRRKLINNKEIHLKYTEDLKKESGETLELSHNTLIERAGGSISNLPVQTKEFNDWIEEQRKIRNPLIGKSYITSASEYNSEQFKLDDQTELHNDEAIQFVNNESEKASNVDESQKILTETESSTDTHDIKFIDMAIIENSVQKKLSCDKDVITSTAIDDLKKYHNDDNYETELDTNAIVEQTHQFLLTQEINTKLLK